jgi:hypothetical protein
LQKRFPIAQAKYDDLLAKENQIKEDFVKKVL